MKKILILLIAALGTGASLFASDKVVLAEIDTTLVCGDIPNSYESLKISSVYKVVYGAATSDIKIVVDRNIAPYVEVEMSGSELKIGLKPVHAKNLESIEIRMPEIPSLKEVKLSGACIFDSRKVIGGDLEIDLSGASKFASKVDLEKLDIEMKGASSVTLKGSARKAEIDCSGSSCVQAEDEFKVEDLELDLNGSSSVKDFTCEKLRGEMSGASSVYLKGPVLVGEFSGTGASKFIVSNKK